MNLRQHGIEPLRKQLVRFFEAGDNGHVPRFPAAGDSQRGRRRRYTPGNRVRRPAEEDASDGLTQQRNVHALMLADEQQVHEISIARGTAALVGSRVRVGLLGDLHDGRRRCPAAVFTIPFNG